MPAQKQDRLTKIRVLQSDYKKFGQKRSWRLMRMKHMASEYQSNLEQQKRFVQRNVHLTMMMTKYNDWINEEEERLDQLRQELGLESFYEVEHALDVTGMVKYKPKVTWRGLYLEKCNVKRELVFIGGLACNICEYCYAYEKDRKGNTEWLVCVKINEARTFNPEL